jgi:16S rRNA (cytosine967-C5)-methyltransferase
LGWKELSPIEGALGRILGFNIELLFEGVSDEDKVSLKTFHPIWFVRYCMRLIGRSEALSLFYRNMEPPPIYLRVNTLRGEEENILTRINTDGITVEPVSNLRFLYKVKESEKPLTKTTSFKDGLFYIQDKSSCLAVEVCNPTPESTVLDVCAAPGGKTTYLAQLMKNKGRIYSIDYSNRRMRVYMREITRMGVEINRPIIADAYIPLPIDVKADVVLLDPPCSSSGSFWKTPSAKWQIDLRTIRHLSVLQYNMLESSSEKVNLGGSLVYSTCSVMLEENEYLIEKFLKNHPNFTLIDTEPNIGLPALRDQKGAQRLYPHIHDANGYYIAKLRKFMD